MLASRLPSLAAVPAQHGFARRATLGLALGGLAGLALGCQGHAKAETAGELALEAELPSALSKDTKLVLGDPQVQKQLELNGRLATLPYSVDFQNLTGGPQTIEAFRAGALDGGSVGDTPPIHAGFTGLDVKIVAVQVRSRPTFELATAPGVKLRNAAELRGKRVAYAPGQAQGALILRVLKQAGLWITDVKPVELKSAEFKDALASNQVDVAPLSGPILYRYLKEYRAQGGSSFPHGVRDTLSFFYVRTAVLRDAKKAAALRHYAALRASAQLWAYTHPAEWVDAFYVKDQGLTREDGQSIVDGLGRPEFPTDWAHIIAATQETIDLLARASGKKRFDAKTLFDLRFERVALDDGAPRKSEKTL